MDIENAKAQMRKGVLELCILAIIEEDEVYPGDIISRLKSNDLIVVEGTLYPLLTRLKNDGLLDYSWRESNAGPPRKYFKITDLGLQFLEALSSSWNQLVSSVAQTVGKPKATKKARKKEPSSDDESPLDVLPKAEMSTTEEEPSAFAKAPADEPTNN
ncbi:MAG: PadR family transcriptional regulator [Saprospiraceae bacterium]